MNCQIVGWRGICRFGGGRVRGRRVRVLVVRTEEGCAGVGRCGFIIIAHRPAAMGKEEVCWVSHISVCSSCYQLNNATGWSL